MSPAGRFGSRSGSSLVEFSVTGLMTILMMLFVVEMGRIVLVCLTMANAARAGVRYAIVHGSTRATGSTINSASGPANNPTEVVTVTKNFASAAPITLSLLVITVTYPNSSNAPGQPVSVSIVYPYDPLTTYFAKTLRLGSAAEGIIVF